MGRASRRKRERPHRQWNTAIQTPEEAKRMAIYTKVVALKQPKGMCATCAFRPGTEANTSSENLLSIEACLGGWGSFNCHAGGVINENGFLVEGTEPGSRCRGWLALQESLEDMSFLRLIASPSSPSTLER